MARKISFAPGEWYHCFSRGVDKRQIYMDYTDYRRFQMLLYASNGDAGVRIHDISRPLLEQEPFYQSPRGNQIVEIGAYALMPNHYHILLREKIPGGITSFMRRLNTGYAMYFNTRYERTGALFSGKFKAIHVDNDTYLRRVVNYIHGNPTELFEHGFKSGMIVDGELLKKRIRTYAFASLCDYGEGSREEAAILDTDALRECLDSPPSIDGVIEDFNTFYARKSNLDRLWK